jgi:hypothetical protein
MDTGGDKRTFTLLSMLGFAIKWLRILAKKL